MLTGETVIPAILRLATPWCGVYHTRVRARAACSRGDDRGRLTRRTPIVTPVTPGTGTSGPPRREGGRQVVATVHRPAAGRHRTDQAPSVRVPQRRGRGRHVAGPDHPRRRRIVALSAVTVATAVALPVVTSPRVADVTVGAWQRLGGAPAPAPAVEPVEPVEPSASTAPPSPSPEPPDEPPDEPPEPAEPPDELTATHRVVWGDTLVRIGAEHAMTWREVYDANVDVIGDNPNLVVVGTILRVRPT